ncbi:MAG TPA: glycosyltransferase, partial [Deltaproteobacteria bacterium]|nr:glycosyltransferase [Deltaproteobacteria bacterium]
VQDRRYFETEVEPHIDGREVIYAGSVGPEERDGLLGGACALLHPISFDEPFGLSVVEAMACGTPVIAINRGSMAEIIEDGVNGFLVRDTDGLVRAVGRIKEIDRSRCRASVERRFSAERMVDDYIRLYERIVEGSRREERRPWGRYEVLGEGGDHKVKRITVRPGKRLSYQRHRRRSEHWYVVSGRAVVTRDGERIELAAGEGVDIPARSWHRIENPGPGGLVFIEVQRGEYFGEDDIERSEDDYGRA